MNRLRHIVVAIPLPYHRDRGFWERDAGLLARGFREIGYRTTLVALKEEEELVKTDKCELDGLELGSKEELESPEWWCKLAPDAAVVFGWGLHHFEKIRHAIRSVTPLLAERMDTDGMRSPILDPFRFSYLSWAQAMDRLGACKSRSWKFLPAAVTSFLWTTYSLAVAPWRGRAAARVASRIPVLLLESEPARKLTVQWLEMFGCSSKAVYLCPHSVDTEKLPVPTSAQKKPNRVVAVGRWLSFQKNFDAALHVAKEFLARRTDYEVHFIGEAPRIHNLPDRMIMHGRVDGLTLGRLLLEARILFATSRYESFHLAAAEALCCGCSVVLPKSIPTAASFAGCESGTAVETSSVRAITEALLTEAKTWDEGARHPESIAAHWRPIFAARSQAQTILKLWNDSQDRLLWN